MYLFIYLFICSFIHSIIHLVLMQLSTHIKSLKMIFAPLPIKVQYSQFVLKCFTIFNSNQQKSTDFSPKICTEKSVFGLHKQMANLLTSLKVLCDSDRFYWAK